MSLLLDRPYKVGSFLKNRARLFDKERQENKVLKSQSEKGKSQPFNESEPLLKN